MQRQFNKDKTTANHRNISHPEMDTAVRTLRPETSKRGGPMPLATPVQQEVAKETLTPLFTKNWASHLLRGGMLGSKNREKESKMAVAKRPGRESPRK